MTSNIASSTHERKMLPAIEEAIGYLDLKPEDVGIAQLAMGYARTIDQAAAIAAAASRIPSDPTNPAIEDQVRKLAARVSAHATMADLGPKLQAALDALGATPKARTLGNSGRPPIPATGGKLRALREASAG